MLVRPIVSPNCRFVMLFRRYAVIRTDNSHINREELLYLLRGGRLDDKVSLYMLNN